MTTSHRLWCRPCSQEYLPIVESGISIDYCPSCNMVWFDKEELTQYSQRNGITLLTSVEERGGSHISGCPRCDSTLLGVQQAATPFWACTSCGGHLISSQELDHRLHDPPQKRPLHQLDGPVSIIDLLNYLTEFLHYWT